MLSAKRLVLTTKLQKGVPDQMFAVITPEGPEILVIDEFKAPGIVTEVLSVVSK